MNIVRRSHLTTRAFELSFPLLNEQIHRNRIACNKKSEIPRRLACGSNNSNVDSQTRTRANECSMRKRIRGEDDLEERRRKKRH